jgi:hypothetical protein
MQTKTAIKIVLGVATVASFTWLYFDRSFEPVITSLVTFVAFIGSLSVENKINANEPINQHVSSTRIQPPIWTEYIKVGAETGIPLLATSAKIQYRIWSDYDNIPLLIRIASDNEAKFVQEASGPSGVVDLLLTENQTFYVSLSNPHLKFEISIVGFSY